MTILENHCGESPGGPGPPEAPARKPHRKAVLIGIQYDSLHDSNPLKGPHTDVEGMRKLLIGASDLLAVLVFSDGQRMQS